MRNLIPIYTRLDGELVSHFMLREFEYDNGKVMIDHFVVRALEYIRRDLNTEFGGRVNVIITCATRTQAENEALAKILGYTDMGGAVARDSRHLEKYGGIAVDFYVRDIAKMERIPAALVGNVARRYFDYVKNDYKDGHIHGDMRAGATKIKDMK